MKNNNSNNYPAQVFLKSFNILKITSMNEKNMLFFDYEGVLFEEQISPIMQ